MDETITLKVITGSVRNGRFNDQAAGWITDIAQGVDGVEAEMVDIADYDMPFFNAAVSPAFKEEPYEHEAVARFTEKIAEADAYIVVTPEYNHGTSGVLKNALDWVYQEWNNKPVAFVSYGNAGGARAIEQLRQNVIELQMAPIRADVRFPGEEYFPVLFGKADAEEMFAGKKHKADDMLEQLLWWARALKAAR